MSNQMETHKKPNPVLKLLCSKIIFGIIGIVIVLAIGFGIGKIVSSDSKTTKLGFEDIGELATQVAYCTEVNVTDASRNLWKITIPFTQSKYIYSYDVMIKAGFDFADIEWYEDEANSMIKVKLPEVTILSNEINPDSFKLYHESESIFRQITMEENNEALATLKQQAEKNAVANGLLENARDNAEIILRGFFAQQYDLEEYTIEFSDK